MSLGDLDQIVKAYDVRGGVPDECDERLAELFGGAFVDVTGADAIVVGQDTGLGDIRALTDPPPDVVPMQFDLDRTFSHHEANPTNPKNVVGPQALVHAEKAQVRGEVLTLIREAR